MSAPLGRYRVLDLAGARGALCGRLLADLGAEVVLVEPPGGSELRNRPPLRQDDAAPAASIWFAHSGANKSHLLLDVASEHGRSRVLELAEYCDVVLESWDADERRALRLEGDAWLAANPALVVTSITGFGLTGPYADYRSSDLIAMAMGGLLFQIGDPDREPCVAPLEQAYGMTAIHAAFATLVALAERESGAPGQVVDLSMHEVMTHLTFALSHYSGLQQVTRRTGSVHGVVPNAPFPASDGYVSISLHDDRMWPRFVEWLGRDELRAEEFHDRSVRADAALYLEPLIAEATAQKTRRQLTDEGQVLRLAVAPINTLGEFVQSEHARSHRLFQERQDGAGHRATVMPLRLGLTRTPPEARQAASRLEDGEATLGPRARHALPGKQARLAGMRVLDLTRVWAGPFCTRLLADFGAEVIRVESLRRPDTSRVIGELANPASKRRSQAMFSELNRNKRSVALDLSTDEGRGLAQRLARQCDLIVDNLAPGVTERMGLGYDTIAATHPGIITLSMPAFGSEGPLHEYVGYGGSLMAYTGMMDLWGLPDTRPESLCHLAYPDYITAAFGALAAMTALLERAESGRGQRIDLAQVDTHAWLMGPAFLESIENGTGVPRIGNRSRFAAPHGLYQCRGDDAWLAIACETDVHWARLVAALGTPAWARESGFDEAVGRLAGAERIDEGLREWASTLTPFTAMRVLQEHGVPAGLVQNGEDLYRDPQHRERGYAVELDDPEAGRLTNPGLTARLTCTPGAIRRTAPLLGEANDYVFGELLGLSHEEVAALETRGIAR